MSGHCPTCTCPPGPRLYPVSIYLTCPDHDIVTGIVKVMNLSAQNQWVGECQTRHAAAGCNKALVLKVHG